MNIKTILARVAIAAAGLAAASAVVVQVSEKRKAIGR